MPADWSSHNNSLDIRTERHWTDNAFLFPLLPLASFAHIFTVKPYEYTQFQDIRTMCAVNISSKILIITAGSFSQLTIRTIYPIKCLRLSRTVTFPCLCHLPRDICSRSACYNCLESKNGPQLNSITVN